MGRGHMRSHPTRYAGVQFRSRLEARWAAFFDVAGWEWLYEPFDDESWVPDFVLPRSGVAIEVKPIEWPYVAREDVRKLMEMFENREDLEKVRSSKRNATNLVGSAPGVLTLGAYPIPLLGFPIIVGFMSVERPYEDVCETEFVFLYEGVGRRFDLGRSDYFHHWLGSGEQVVRDSSWKVDRKRPLAESMHTAWREAGNRVQWKGAGARPPVLRRDPPKPPRGHFWPA